MARDKKRAMTEEAGTLGSILRAPFEAMLAHNYARIRELGFDDIRVAHGAVLRNIAADGSRITELAAHAGMTKQSMAELVAYLREHGYVEVSPDPEDRRGKLVKLTDRGIQVFQSLAEASYGFEADCARLLGKAKWERFRSLLADVALVVQTMRDEDVNSTVR